MKSYISTDKECVSVQIIECITLLTKRVANKYATFGTSVKCLSWMDNNSITEKAKNPEMTKRWRSVVQKLKRRFVGY